MAAPEENFGKIDLTGVQENSRSQQKSVHHDDSGVGTLVKKWPGWPGDSVFRLLVPAQKVGGIIGRKGEFIKKMCEESRARIKILDCPPGIPERVVMISAKEEQDASIPPAVDGLLRVHKRTVDGLDNDSAHAQPGPGAMVTSRLLVAASQAGSLIGRQGAVVKSIQDATNVVVRVLPTEDLPVIALQEDRVVEVQGEHAGVHKAIEAIAFHLRKFLVDHSVLPLFEKNASPVQCFTRIPMSIPNSRVEPSMPQPSWGNHPQGLPNAGGSGFGGNSHFIPPWQHDSYYPPPDHPLEKHPRQSLPSFGRDIPMGVHPSINAQPAAPIIKQVTQNMQIPLAYADAVIGTGGASISYIRRASGATIIIQESRGVPGEMTVEINGSATQVQTAQQLIQNFMAEAAGPTQNATGSVDQGFNSFQSHGSMFASAPTNARNAADLAGGSYSSVYGANYGY